MDEGRARRGPAAQEAAPYLSPTPEGGLLWGPLTEGILLRRYKRFLADVELPGGMVTAHTANTGAMLGCCEPGRPVWLSYHDVPSRKLKYSLEMIAMPTALVGVNTGVPNRLVKAAVMAGCVPELGRPAEAVPEVKFGGSRLDLLLRYPDAPDALTEIKNCTLADNGTAYFPDAVTVRGSRHLEELTEAVQEGMRGVIFILVQRDDADRFRPADHIDPAWGQALRRAVKAGVELLVYRAVLSTVGITLGARLPADL